MITRTIPGRRISQRRRYYLPYSPLLLLLNDVIELLLPWWGDGAHKKHESSLCRTKKKMPNRGFVDGGRAVGKVIKS